MTRRASAQLSIDMPAQMRRGRRNRVDYEPAEVYDAVLRLRRRGRRVIRAGRWISVDGRKLSPRELAATIRT